MSFVVDNSVALAWCFEDEQTADIMAVLDRIAENGAFAPQLWPIEALNGLLTAERRGRIDSAVSRAAGDKRQAADSGGSSHRSATASAGGVIISDNLS